MSDDKKQNGRVNLVDEVFKPEPIGHSDYRHGHPDMAADAYDALRAHEYLDSLVPRADTYGMVFSLNYRIELALDKRKGGEPE